MSDWNGMFDDCVDNDGGLLELDLETAENQPQIQIQPPYQPLPQDGNANKSPIVVIASTKTDQQLYSLLLDINRLLIERSIETINFYKDMTKLVTNVDVNVGDKTEMYAYTQEDLNKLDVLANSINTPVESSNTESVKKIAGVINVSTEQKTDKIVIDLLTMIRHNLQVGNEHEKLIHEQLKNDIPAKRKREETSCDDGYKSKRPKL